MKQELIPFDLEKARDKEKYEIVDKGGRICRIGTEYNWTNNGLGVFHQMGGGKCEHYVEHFDDGGVCNIRLHEFGNYNLSLRLIVKKKKVWYGLAYKGAEARCTYDDDLTDWKDWKLSLGRQGYTIIEHEIEIPI